MRPQLPEYGAWLRTSALADEIGWDGFDTAMHELGHTLEQLISTHFVPRPALRGVPNTACTEAFAFLYQSLGKRVLGAASADDEARGFDIDTVQTLASACQIAGPALLELRVWNWIYRNPAATAAELRAEVLAVAERLWAEFYAIDFGPDPYRILAAYQHMIAHPLYLPDYPIGHIISHQVRSHMRGKDLAAETRRICSIGSVTPDLWMRRAVGSGLDVGPLVRDAGSALDRLASL
jgi:oligoendopeptidase F